MPREEGGRTTTGLILTRPTAVVAGDILWGQASLIAEAHRALAAIYLQGNLIAGPRAVGAGRPAARRSVGAARHLLALADHLRRDGRCLDGLHICYTVMKDFPENQTIWSATDKAWRCAGREIGAGTSRATTWAPPAICSTARPSSPNGNWRPRSGQAPPGEKRTHPEA